MDFKIGIDENKETKNVNIKIVLCNGAVYETTIPEDEQYKMGLTIYHIITSQLISIVRGEVREKLKPFGFEIKSGRPIQNEYITEIPEEKRKKEREKAKKRYYEKKKEKTAHQFVPIS
jgi:hypothetical protein